MAFMVCLLLFSVGSVQSSIQLSVGFRVYSVQCQFSVCSVQGVYCSVGHSPSVLFNQSPHFERPLPLRSS